MKTYTIRWIIGLISIALIGLLCVQFYWVNNAVSLKQVLFRQSVSGALNEVVSRLEKREVASAVAQTVTLVTEPEHNTQREARDGKYIFSAEAHAPIERPQFTASVDSNGNILYQHDNLLARIPALSPQPEPATEPAALWNEYVPQQETERAALRERTIRERTIEEKKDGRNSANRYVQPSSNRSRKQTKHQRENTVAQQMRITSTQETDHSSSGQTVWRTQQGSEQMEMVWHTQSLQLRSPAALVNITTSAGSGDATKQVYFVNADSLRCGVQLMVDSPNESRQEVIITASSAKVCTEQCNKKRADGTVSSCTHQCNGQQCSHECKQQCSPHQIQQSRKRSFPSQALKQYAVAQQSARQSQINREKSRSIEDVMEKLADQQQQARERLQLLEEAMEEASMDFSFPEISIEPIDNSLQPIGAQQQYGWTIHSNGLFSRNEEKVRIDRSASRLPQMLARSAKKAPTDVPQAETPSAPSAPPAPPPTLRKRVPYTTVAQQPVRDKLLSIQDMASRVVVELATSNKPIEQRITPALVDSMLKEELLRRGITIPYQYAVLSQNNEFPLIKPALYTEELQQSDFRTALYPNDIISKPYFLSIYFPQKDAFIYESMWGVLATSLAFILLLMGCFSFAVVTLVRQKKLSDMKTDFINNMTHEFKTPISTISLASEALRDPIVRTDDNRITRFVNAIYEENRRLGTQVERVLQAAVIDRGDIQLNRTPVHLHNIMQQALCTVALQIESRGGSIACQFEADDDLIHADKIHLTNIIINLLDNANKYSPNNPLIAISTRNSSNGVIVSVEDRGMGMSREAQKRIFEKFYRVSTGNLHDVKGFGLGLSYVKAMVEAHGGNICVWSEVKKGSRFDLYFPHENPKEL